jgi:general secretion pathway protein A
MYLSYYGLREEPFRLTPDPRFLQLPEPHRDALTMLVHGVVDRRGLTLLSGPIGTGKTTILNGMLSVLARRKPPKPLPTALIVNPRVTSDELLEMLLLEFEVTGGGTSRPARLAALQRLLFDTLTSGGTCLLVVDEAHLLSKDVMEEIRLLMNTESYREKLLQVVLCGQPELTRLLNEPEVKPLRQRIAERAILRPLSQSEMRMYIRERLRIAGFDAPVPFNSSSLDKIYECTGGVPRLINIVCDTCLLIGSESKRTQISDDIVEEAAARHDLTADSAAPGDGNRAAKPNEPVELTPLQLFGGPLQAAKIAGQGEL